MKNKVVYNDSYGGFSLSKAARKYLAGFGISEDVHDYDIKRHDPRLVQVVENLGIAANGECADLQIMDIHDECRYHIEEYDGLETVTTPQNTAWIEIEENHESR